MDRISEVQFLAGAGIFLITTTARLATELTQSAIPWVLVVLSLGVQ